MLGTNSQSEEARLRALRESMTPEKQEEMSELLQNELKRRSQKRASVGLKSSIKKGSMGGLDGDSLGEMYNELNDSVQSARIKALEKKASKLEEQKARLSTGGKMAAQQVRKIGTIGKPLVGSNAFLAILIVGLAGLKVFYSISPVDAADAATSVDMTAESSADVANYSRASLEPVAAAVATDLDARRVELEKRDEALDRREEQLKAQAEALASRSAELRSLTEKLKEFRKQRDEAYETRLEQLASVYSSMAPQEAAPLVARLDDKIALALLKRMPGKRMGQILSLMNGDRAIELTRSLTNKAEL